MGWIINNLIGFTIFLLIIGSFGLYVYWQLTDVGDFIEFCQEEGYDGIRMEKVNFMRDEPRCTNFTAEDRYKMKQSEEFNEKGQEVWDAFSGMFVKSENNEGDKK